MNTKLDIFLMMGNFQKKWKLWKIIDAYIEQ